MKEYILVIKLGALGDLMLCMPAFAAIRAHHPDAKIALLTGPAFVDFARQMPWFDEVLTDPRPKLTDVAGWRKLVGAVRIFAPSRVYDLQGKFRQSLLFWGVGGALLGPQWSGAARFCSHPRLWPPVPGMHYTDFVAAQLEQAEVPYDTPADLSWLDASLESFPLSERYALIIPGCSPAHSYKRWPAAHYAELAKKLAERGILTMAVGTKTDADSIAAIRALVPEVVDLSGQTTLKQLAALARRAVCVVGNDTGPTHLAAAVGARTVALMSDRVDPLWSAPKGPQATWLQGKPLESLAVESVLKELYSVL